jgi:hypothetical protein
MYVFEMLKFKIIIQEILEINRPEVIVLWCLLNLNYVYVFWTLEIEIIIKDKIS